MEHFSLSVVVSGMLASFVIAGSVPINAATPTATPVSIAATSTATLSPEPTPAPDGCVAHVSKLPASPLYHATDRRLGARTVVVVLKAKRRLMLFSGGKSKGCWHVGLGSGTIAGTKHREGDLKTPEGWYRTSDKPWSSYYGAIAIHYPNALDAKRGLRAGQITKRTYRRILRALRHHRKPPQHTALGGEVLIHGGGGSSDWTLGCVALDNDHLDDLRAALPKHKRFDVLILP